MRHAIAFTLVLTALLACSDPGGVTSIDEGTAVVTGTAYVDLDGDGALGTGDTPVAGAQVSLLVHATGDTVARAQSIANGTFVLRNLAAGTYRLEVDLGSMRDSLAVLSTGATPLVVARGDSAFAQVRVGYSATRTSVAGARALPPGQRVILSGVALNGSPAFGDSTLHLMDATGAIRVTQVRAAVALGDSIRVLGTIAVRAGQPVLAAAVTAIELASAGTPDPDSVSTGAAAGAAAGLLDAAQVAVTGMVTTVSTDASGDVLLTIDDGSGALLVELHASAGFVSTSFAAGQAVRARGVLVPDESAPRWILRPRATWDIAVTAGEVLCSAAGAAGAYACRGIDLVAFIPTWELGGGQGIRLNDIWGWTDVQTGREYAIVGRSDGTAFVDITNPLKPVLVANLPKTAAAFASTWRDMKVYSDHVFVVADGAGAHGMQVVDL
ncbi:MAG TPA: choice-of-anchor B family protein, partial [Longimicrobiales bacterium]|nr:choice-of-anchor B family protein [Longimicrobiales bacterium]